MDAVTFDVTHSPRDAVKWGKTSKKCEEHRQLKIRGVAIINNDANELLRTENTYN